jgi:putative ABC transport system ATP-binding protein
MDFIQVNNLSKSFKVGRDAISVISNVNFTIKKGDFVVVLGPSGSGKTTLFNLLSGLDKPDEGEIIIDGEDITKFSTGKLSLWRSENVGIVFQSFNLMTYMSAIDNVALPLVFKGVSRKNRYNKASALLRTVDLKHRYDYPANVLSGGEQQRVAIARALVNNPKLLIADEPTGDLDLTNATEVMQIIYDLYKEKKATIILSTHNANYAKYADQVVYVAKKSATTQKGIKDEIS